MRKMKFIFLWVVIAIMALTTAASADFKTYFEETAFVNAIAQDYYLEDFSRLPEGTLTSPLSFSGGEYAYTISAAGGLVASGGVLSTTAPSMLIEFTGAPVYAAGGMLSGYVNVLFCDDSHTYLTGTGSFLGLTSDAQIASMTITGTSPSVSHFYDAEIPLPPTALLLGSGLLGLVGLGWRRRKTNV